jgi:ABC-2 type transport system ATP-binding protein
MGTPVLNTEALSKRYGGGKKATLALENLNLTTEQGEIFGFLGPNGAGKTTTIKLLLDLIRPTSGHAKIFGLDVNTRSMDVRKRVGYLPGELELWNNQRAAHVIQYYGKLRGGLDSAFVSQLEQRLEFDPSKKIREYSSGNKRKLGLILALMHKPDLLILDEPTSGLDPLVQQTFLQLMREAREGGQSVFLSSHMLSEVQAICDRVGILRDGKLEEVKRVIDLMKQDYRVVIVRLRDPAPASLYTALPFVSGVIVNGREAQFHLTGPFNPLLEALRGVYVEDLNVVEPSLEDIFLTYYGDHPTNGAVNPAQKQPQMEVAS